jgi:signal transduction histidine kinase
MASALAVLLAGILVAVDFATWIELNVSIAFTVPLLIASLSRSRRLLWTIAVALIAATFVAYSRQIAPGAFAPHETFFVDRLMSSATVLAVSIVLSARMRFRDLLDREAVRLAAQNEQLEAANLALDRHKKALMRRGEELDSLRAAAQEESGRKTRLLRAASHDIRSPVNAINLMAEVIRRSAESPILAARIPRLAQRLQANAIQLGEMLSEVLDASALESGRSEVHVSEFPVHDVLVDTCHRLAPLADAKGIALGVLGGDTGIRVRTDRLKLMRILTNLVGNAIKFTEAGGVALSASASTRHGIELTVRDTGCGIANADLERIFGEQERISSDASCEEGWGLGLVICRRMAKLLGAEITVESRLGKGSAFTVRLPGP